MSTLYNRKIQAIVIHHMGDGKNPNVPIAQRWNPYNYEFPEYDFGVEADGTIVQGRILTVQGAHCISDKPPYSQKGDQWWNKNSIGIGLAGDFTKFPMPQAQFNGLVILVERLMTQYNLTLDNVYPHGQITYTDCPGCIYDKVTALKKGLWNYNDFEKAVNSFSNSSTIVAPSRSSSILSSTPTPSTSVMYRIIVDNKQTMSLSNLDNSIAELKRQIDISSTAKNGIIQRNSDNYTMFTYSKPQPIVKQGKIVFYLYEPDARIATYYADFIGVKAVNVKDMTSDMFSSYKDIVQIGGVKYNSYVTLLLSGNDQFDTIVATLKNMWDIK